MFYFKFAHSLSKIVAFGLKVKGSWKGFREKTRAIFLRIMLFFLPVMHVIKCMHIVTYAEAVLH